MGPEKGHRAKLMRAIHAEAQKRGIDHDGLRDMFKVRSLSMVETNDLVGALKTWTGRGVRKSRPRAAAWPARSAEQLPRKGYGKNGETELVGGDDLNTLAEAFARRGMGKESQANFIRRQLGGRDSIRTRADFHKVFSGIRAMNRREGI
ncbi:MAG TPA: hypothetical protein VG273_11910 [Bryobacteraceae bacterium]|nr:hypothetical protein [Bryobacteraceae bacterium]